jgi:hypothetical protein
VQPQKRPRTGGAIKAMGIKSDEATVKTANYTALI